MVEPPLPILYVDQRRVTTRAVTIYQTEHNGTRHAIKVLRPTPYDQAQGEIIIQNCRHITSIRTFIDNLCAVRLREVQIDGFPVLGIESDWLPNVFEYLKSNLYADKSRLVKDLAEILSSLHSANILHGNIYPGNVMVAPGGRVLVADVGLNACMRQLIDSLWVTFVQDNWPFKSPEELNSPNGIVTAAGDTYAFAVTAYAIYHTKPPFRSFNSSQGMVHISRYGHSRLQQPAGMSTCMWEILRQCWETEPGNRPGMAEVTNVLRSL